MPAITTNLLKRVPGIVETIHEGLEKSEIQFGTIPKIVFRNEEVLEIFSRLFNLYSLQLIEEDSLDYLCIIRRKETLFSYSSVVSTES